MSKIFFKIVIFALFTRAIFFTFPWITSALLQENSQQTLFEFTKSSWSRWDAPHYIYLAQSGYTNTGDEANFIVFFPLYPLLLKASIALFSQPTITAIFLSTLLFIAGLYFFIKVVAMEFGDDIAEAAAMCICIFPTSYFFSLPYTESLFFLNMMAAFYFAKSKNWILSGFFCGLATLTRPYGFLVVSFTVIEWIKTNGRKIRVLPSIFIPTIVASATYLFLNYKVFGDYFMFQKILETNWQKHLSSPVQGLLSTWHIALTGKIDNFGVMVGWAEALTLTTSWILIPFIYKYFSKSWFVFYLASIVLFSSTSFILSTPRYLLSLPHMFVLIAIFGKKNNLFKVSWDFVSAALLITLSLIYSTGQWAF